TGPDGVTAAGNVSVFNDRIDGDHGLVSEIAHLHWDAIDSRQARSRVVRLQNLISFALGVAVVGALMHDVYVFPSVQPDRVRDEAVVCGVIRIDGPRQSMRIAEAICP